MRAMRLISLLCVALVACGDDGGQTTITPDAPTTTGCGRVPAAADRPRFVVIAHPYTTSGAASAAFEVVQLSATGTLSRFTPSRTFMLATRAPFGTITFTPDGEVGLVALDDGKLGVFKLDPEGNATVINPGIDAAFYADRIVMDPSGDRAWVVDSNTRENGGGIYEIAIGCDGVVTERGLVAAARSAGGFALLEGNRAVIAAREVLTSAAGEDVHLLEWGTPPTLRGGTDAFGDDDVIASGFAVNHTGTTAFLGDSNVTGTNRVAIVGIGETDITMLGVISGITDPSGIAASPFGDVAIVTSSQPPGEGIYALDKGGANGAWRNRGEITYMGAAAQLPGDVVTIDRGQLAGSVFVSELAGVRRVAFGATGTVEDKGLLALGDGLENIPGAIGVTP
jgi:hypothetical protein